jgi:hypothetical protein
LFITFFYSRNTIVLERVSVSISTISANHIL